MKRPIAAVRDYPWRCDHCRKVEVVPSMIQYDAEVRHDGRLYQFTIFDLRILVCGHCGEPVFTREVDDQVNMALRSHLRLLTPNDIRDGLERLGLNQKTAAERLGVAEATLSRWLTGTQIQSRAMDNLLRLFFGLPEVRAALQGEGQDPKLGTVFKLG